MKANRVPILIEWLPHGADLDLPTYQTAGAAGLDLHAALPESGPLKLKPKQRALIPTGLILQLPDGYEAQVRPRSGLAAKHGITVLNSPGTIDSDYRGEVQVLLINLGGEPFTIRRGDRIAQLVVQPVIRAALKIVARTSTTKRGAGGFGSTGTAESGPARKRAKKDTVPPRAPRSKSAAPQRRKPGRPPL